LAREPRLKPGRLMKETAPGPLIAGGGHAGLLLALALGRAGLPVTLIEAEPLASVRDAPSDGRALALMYGSKRVFDALGLWPAVAAIAEPVWGVRVSDRGSGAKLAYDALEIGRHPFGYGIENRRLRRRLLLLVEGRPGIEVIAPARLARLERRADRVTVTLDDGRQLAAALVVGADGRGSTVRELAGLGAEHWRYPQIALTFAIRHRRPHHGQVREYLRPAGPLALLPLGPGLSAVTWVEREPAAQHLLASPAADLLEALLEQVGDELGPLELCGRPNGYPLSGHRARRLVGPRVALVGDAAHAVHPIHAQGFNLGVRDVAALAEVLVDAARAGQDPGSGEVLIRYQRWRQADARLVVGLTDGLNRLFSTDLAPARLLRAAGLNALGWLAPLRHLAMRRGMGLAGDLPKLARGEGL
jgi:2-octaprenyl-6-methoxyphenol hydroxylase